MDQISSSPRSITIVGLGPGAVEELTLAAWRALSDARLVLLRTRRHPCVAELPNQEQMLDCDDLYEQHEQFHDVYVAVVDRLFQLLESSEAIVYAVPGHPHVGEATTPLILKRAAEIGATVTVLGGLSFVEPAFAALGVDLMDGAQIVDAMLLARQHHPKVEPGLPLLIAQVYARWLASDLKLTLLNAYPPDHAVSVIHAAGTPNQRIRSSLLCELDFSDDFDHLTSVFAPALPVHSSFADLQEIVAHLRAPEGCPWDREQTLASLRHDLLSECTEVLEAIDIDEAGDDNGEHIAEELGDLIMAALMMVQIATEEGRFQLSHAMHSIVTKLIRRHPHVFGDAKVNDVGDVLVNWAEIKAQEKAAKGIAPAGPLDGVPAALPALEKARELQSKAAKAGLLDRHALAHENPALVAAIGQPQTESAIAQALWQIVALAKQAEINCEDALRGYAVAFRQKF